MKDEEKRRSRTMTGLRKNIITLGLGAAVLLGALCPTVLAEGTVPAGAEAPEAQSEAVQKETGPLETAFQAALTDAGLEESQVTDIEIDLDRGLKGIRYEIDFETRDTRYEYTVTEQGEITGRRTNEILAAIAALRKDVDNSGCIGVAAAVSIALEDADLKEAEARDLKAELDSGLKRLQYQVEFETAGMEWEYRIDADTGEIRSVRNDD